MSQMPFRLSNQKNVVLFGFCSGVFSRLKAQMLQVNDWDQCAMQKTPEVPKVSKTTCQSATFLA